MLFFNDNQMTKPPKQANNKHVLFYGRVKGSLLPGMVGPVVAGSALFCVNETQFTLQLLE